MHDPSRLPPSSGWSPASPGRSPASPGRSPAFPGAESSVPGALSASELDQCLSVRDLADPAQGPHAMQAVLDTLVGALANRWNCVVRVVRDHPVVSLDDNYEHLGFPADAVTREERYTRYADAEHVLRSHSSAMIPGALRKLAAESAPPADLLLACPGVCYRRDSVDWQHTGTPQQLDLWRICHDRPCGEDDLVEMIDLVVAAALPGSRWRAVPKVHPYTLAGRQVDVWWEGQWIEIGECGLAGPSVLAGAGLAGPPWSGLAMGLGLDRLLMLRKGIPDIRLLRSADPRVAAQMLDLEPYRPVSHMPPVRRDLSMVVGDDTEASAEILGDRVRGALGLGCRRG